MLARHALRLSPLTLLLFPGVGLAQAEKEGMPQLDPHSYASQLFWLSVFFILIFLFLRFVGLPRVTAIMDARASKIDSDINAAELLRTQAEETHKNYEAAIASARGNARQILAETQERNAATLAQKMKEAVAATDHDVAHAVKRIDALRADALHGLREITFGLAKDITVKLTGYTPDADHVMLAVDKAAGETA